LDELCDAQAGTRLRERLAYLNMLWVDAKDRNNTEPRRCTLLLPPALAIARGQAKTRAQAETQRENLFTEKVVDDFNFSNPE
jgi:hypothetical protein